MPTQHVISLISGPIYVGIVHMSSHRGVCRIKKHSGNLFCRVTVSIKLCAAICLINLHVINVLAGILPCYRQGTRALYFTTVLEEKAAMLNDIRLLKFLDS